MKNPWHFPIADWTAIGAQPKGRARFFALGEVRLAVLSLIAEYPKHGYQLMKEFGARVGPLYRASAGTVYPALKQLEKDGLIEGRLESGRRMYRLTRAGRKMVTEGSAAIGEIWRRAEVTEDLGQHLGPHTVAIAGPLSEILGAALQASAWAAGNPDREDRVRAVLRAAAARLKALMEES